MPEKVARTQRACLARVEADVAALTAAKAEVQAAAGAQAGAVAAEMELRGPHAALEAARAAEARLVDDMFEGCGCRVAFYC